MNGLKEFIEWILNSFKIWIIIQPWESGLRVRFGKHMKILHKGVYLRIPYFDSIYIQETRLRIVQMSIQTLTTKDLKTVTIEGCVGYTIEDLQKLYNTLYQPESTITNIVKSSLSEFISMNDLDGIHPASIEENIFKKLNFEQNGICIKYFKLQNFAIVKTFRLIQDQSWQSNSLYMNNKK